MKLKYYCNLNAMIWGILNTERNLPVNWLVCQQTVIATLSCLHFTYISTESSLEAANFKLCILTAIFSMMADFWWSFNSDMSTILSWTYEVWTWIQTCGKKMVAKLTKFDNMKFWPSPPPGTRNWRWQSTHEISCP